MRDTVHVVAAADPATLDTLHMPGVAQNQPVGRVTPLPSSFASGQASYSSVPPGTNAAVSIRGEAAGVWSKNGGGVFPSSVSFVPTRESGEVSASWSGIAGQVPGTTGAINGQGTSGVSSEGARQRRSAKKRGRGNRGATLLVIALSCCLALLVLAGGGYWFYQINGVAPSSSSAPVAVATQNTYTVVEPVASIVPSPTATSRPTPRPTARPVPTTAPATAPTSTGVSQLIVVSISKQRLTAYSGNKVMMTTLVTTGMPALYTPEGTYHIINRIANAMFTSPWPKSSPYYYAPIHVNYGLRLTWSGIYLHDATWRSAFGPGTNVPHRDPVYGEETGSHGCVEIPLSKMTWLYNWAENGIAVEVVN